MAKKKAAAATAVVTLAGFAKNLESHWKRARGRLIVVATEAFDGMRMELCEQSPNLPAFSELELKSHYLIKSELGFLPFLEDADWRRAAIKLDVMCDRLTLIDDDFAIEIGKGIRLRIAERDREIKDRSDYNAKKSENKIPMNSKVQELCDWLKKKKPLEGCQLKSAREFCLKKGYDPKEARNWIQQARRFPHLWK